MIIRAVVSRWIPLALVVTLTAGIVYATVQQSFRSDADDPQIQIAEDAARAIARGAPPGSVIPAAAVDPSESLSPFLSVFDRRGSLIGSSAVLEGRNPVPPPGVLQRAAETGWNSITWQPRRDVRAAIVIARSPGPGRELVLAGRSLREVEMRENRLVRMVAIFWVITLFAALLAVIGTEWVATRVSTGRGPCQCSLVHHRPLP